jgi:hypothetical protein
VKGTDRFGIISEHLLDPRHLRSIQIFRAHWGDGTLMTLMLMINPDPEQ